MAKATSSRKTGRVCHTDDYKAEALKLADTIGVSQAAQQLGLHASQLYTWRSAAHSKMSKGALEQQQMTEIARLKRQLAEREEEVALLKKAAAYFAKLQK